MNSFVRDCGVHCAGRMRPFPLYQLSHSQLPITDAENPPRLYLFEEVLWGGGGFVGLCVLFCFLFLWRDLSSQPWQAVSSRQASWLSPPNARLTSTQCHIWFPPAPFVFQSNEVTASAIPPATLSSSSWPEPKAMIGSLIPT